MNEATSTALVLDSPEEKQLGKNVSIMEAQVQNVVITNDTDFEYATKLTQQVKQMQKKITDYWEPMRKSAHTAYQSILDHKKEMIDPCVRMEKVLKRKMSDYSMEQERIRREKEAELRRLAQAEVDKKLEEAAKAEKEGDMFAAETAMAEAEVMDGVASCGVVQPAAPKVKGVSKQKAWKITGIDVSKVPVEIAGIVIRPVDEKAVMNLIKATKGQVVIPGITYEETVNISVRA